MSSLGIDYVNKLTYQRVFIFFPLLLLFFPSVTFSIINAEIFPWGIFLFFAYKLRIDKITLVFIFILMLSIIYGGFLRNEISFESIRSLFAYLNVILVSSFVIKCNDYTFAKLEKVIKIALFVYVTLGILQITGLAGFLEPIVDMLIRRGSVSVTEGGRGVRLLASEPARAALEVIFVYGCLRVTNVLSRFTIITDIAIFIFLLFVIKSATGLIFALIFFSLMYPKLSIVNFALLISSLSVISEIELNSRAFHLFLDVISNFSFSNLFDLVIRQSGFRVPSVLSSYIYAMQHPFGGGVGQWMYSSIDALSNLGIPASDISYFRTEFNSQFVAVRPTSFAASVSLDLGVIGFLICMYWTFVNLIKIPPKMKILPMYGMFTFYLLFLGEIGHPIPWICMLFTAQHQIRLSQRDESKNHESMGL